jgi:chloramphenicol 3-O-phosphotransferase
MPFPAPGILLITGIMAAGKSTIAQAAAERLPKSVHLRGDVFRRMIVNDRAEINPGLGDHAMEQLRLRYRIAAAATDLYCQAGFTVVYQDIILGSVLDEVVAMLKKWPLYIVVLCPGPEIAAQRDKTRSKTAYGAWTPHDLDASLRTETPRYGLWLDNSALTIDETVEVIFAQIEQASIR